MKKRADLRKKFFIFSATIVLVPMIVLYSVILAFFTRRSSEETERFAFHNIQSISQTMDAALHSVNEVSLYIISNDSIRGYLLNPFTYSEYAKLNSAMQFLPYSSKYCATVSVISDSKETLVSGHYQNLSISPEDRAKADRLAGASFWSVHEDSVSLIRLMRDTNRLSRSLGYIKIQVSLRDLAASLTSPRDMPKTSYLLLTETGVMLRRGEIPAEVLESEQLRFDALRAHSNDSATLHAGGRTYLFSSRSINSDKVALVSLIDTALLGGLDSLLLTSAIVAAALSAFFVMILVTYYTKRVFSPLERLGQIMSDIEHRDFSFDYHPTGNNEITVLIDRFNMMCKRLKMLHEQVFASEIKLKETEIAVLQSEINPHFLYNTLDTIYWMSEESRTWKISEMVRALSNLLRFALLKAPGGLVPLSLECEHMNSYLTIQRARYQDRVSFEFYVQEGIEGLEVLKLLLQPIVENAIMHGVEPIGGGRIVINIYQEDSDLIYTVYNDGNPVDLGRIQRMLDGDCPDSEGFAIRNVNSRIRYRFGAEYQLIFENQASGGVLATIRQPVRGDGT